MTWCPSLGVTGPTRCPGHGALCRQQTRLTKVVRQATEPVPHLEGAKVEAGPNPGQAPQPRSQAPQPDSWIAKSFVLCPAPGKTVPEDRWRGGTCERPLITQRGRHGSP